MPRKLIIAATTALGLALASGAATAQEFSVGVGFGPYSDGYYGYGYAPSGYGRSDMDDSGHYTRDYNTGYSYYGDDYADEPGNR
ncbi:MAG: hypothetical protein AB7K64_08665 [Variibacter sp.]